MVQEPSVQVYSDLFKQKQEAESRNMELMVENDKLKVDNSNLKTENMTCDARLTVYHTPVEFAWFIEIDRHDGRWTGFVMMDPLKGAVFVASHDCELDGPSAVQALKSARDFVWHLDQLRGQIAVYDFPSVY